MKQLLAIVSFAFVGCLPATFRNGVIACQTDSDCPTYLHCIEGACGGDGARDGGVSATDAGPACAQQAGVCSPTACTSPCSCSPYSGFFGCCIPPKGSGCHQDRDCCFDKDGLGCNDGTCNYVVTGACTFGIECRSGSCDAGNCT
ncbi:MAG: hypothetical protein ACYCWW_01995 [Deltaproteobacteria bacterium]